MTFRFRLVSEYQGMTYVYVCDKPQLGRPVHCIVMPWYSLTNPEAKRLNVESVSLTGTFAAGVGGMVTLSLMEILLTPHPGGSLLWYDLTMQF